MPASRGFEEELVSAMPVRKIIKLGHPTLRQRAKSLQKRDLTKARFKNLLSDMVDTLRDYGGVGLAAPQIDESLRVIIIEIRETNLRYGVQKLFPLTVFVNPEIELIDSQSAGFWEGCLSIPGMRGYVERPQNISVSFIDELGEFGTLELHGFPATVLQHELDHLNGVLYVDRMKDLRSLSFEDEWTRHLKEN